MLSRGMLAVLVLFLTSAIWNLFADPKKDTAPNSNKTDSYRGLGGEELWSNNCIRCHNLRPSTMYSDAQWDVIVHHMRLRANITGAEQHAIVEFLKSSH